MRTALLITDLGGVGGVDTIEALAHGSPSHARACALLDAEVRAAVEGLVAAGFERVVVSDSHVSGSGRPCVDQARLPASAVLVEREDPYAAELMAGVQAVACLGMHAAAGSLGFAANTISVHCALKAGGRELSELDLVAGLAAERGVPLVFASGDDVLRAASPGVHFVETKRALSRSQSRSVAPEAALAALRRAGAQALQEAPPVVAGPLEVHFKSRWQADLAEAGGGSRRSEHVVAVEGDSLSARYAEACRLLELSSGALALATRGAIGSPEFCVDAAGLLARGFDRPERKDTRAQASLALRAFLAQTSGATDEARALRALTLHMLQGHAPAFFAAQGLPELFADALERLASVPTAIAPGLDVEVAMARLDALYVLHAHGRPLPAKPQLDGYIAQVMPKLPLWGWLFSELGAELGLARRLPAPTTLDRISEVYLLTHQVLLATRYLTRPLERTRWGSTLERMTLLAPATLAAGLVDAGGELAFCLRHAGEDRCAEHAALVDAVLARQRPDGSVAEANVESDAHCTAVALLALAPG